MLIYELKELECGVGKRISGLCKRQSKLCIAKKKKPWIGEWFLSSFCKFWLFNWLVLKEWLCLAECKLVFDFWAIDLQVCVLDETFVKIEQKKFCSMKPKRENVNYISSNMFSWSKISCIIYLIELDEFRWVWAGWEFSFEAKWTVQRLATILVWWF